MRIHVLAIALACGCTLDPSSKPECVTDDDCYVSPRGHCVAQVCEPNVLPIGVPDVFYVTPGANTSATVDVDVLTNDIDPEGYPLHVVDVREIGNVPGYIQKFGPTTVRISPDVLPETFQYRMADEIASSEDWIDITIAQLTSRFDIAVEADADASLAPVLATLVDTGPGSIELVSGPTAGTLVGQIPDVTYVPATDYCGPDAVTYRVHAVNGTFDIDVHLAVGILLTGEQQTVAFGAPLTVDVLANDRTGLELVATSASFATITGAKDALIVNPPPDAALSYPISYTARDTRGCEGTATLTLQVEYPTQVVVGAGLTGDAFDAVLSDDGRLLAFTSADSTLVTGDTNAASDVFVLDLVTNVIERVSVATNGAQANDGSGSPTISADGRYVAFVSRATNLAAADTSAVEDIYLHDRTTGATTLVSISVDGTGSDQPSLTPHLSAAGDRVAFASSATRLVSGDTNDVMDVFVRDVGTSTTLRVSVTGSGAQVPFASQLRPRISGNGRYVALSSSSSLDGSNSSGAFLVDTAGSAVSRIDPQMGDVDLDTTGRFVIQADYQVTLVDRVVENTTVLGLGTFPSVSADGRYAAFVDAKTILTRAGMTNVNVIVDRAGMPVAVTPLRRPEMSGDGRWIVFSTSEWPGYVGRFVIVRVWNRAFVN